MFRAFGPSLRSGKGRRSRGGSLPIHWSAAALAFNAYDREQLRRTFPRKPFDPQHVALLSERQLLSRCQRRNPGYRRNQIRQPQHRPPIPEADDEIQLVVFHRLPPVGDELREVPAVGAIDGLAVNVQPLSDLQRPLDEGRRKLSVGAVRRLARLPPTVPLFRALAQHV